ncbi:hypothetical protein BJ170DRAFT_731626 [Xylariales sp. AK1849]|nr:hypothetical protein BJ170DRAFT_731626 [Xylariales sp. AK1849]
MSSPDNNKDADMSGLNLGVGFVPQQLPEAANGDTPFTTTPSQIWEQLRVQLSPFSNVLAIPDDRYDMWTDSARRFILETMMQSTGQQNVQYVRDIDGGRVFLGSLGHLNTAETLIMELPNRDIPVMIPRRNVLGGSAFDSQPTQQSFQQGFQSYQMPQQPSMAVQYGAPPPFVMPATQPSLTLASHPPQQAVTTPEQQTPTKRGSSSKKRKLAHNAPRPSNNRKDPGSGHLNVNAVLIPEPRVLEPDGFKINHKSKYRKNEYRSNGPRPQNAFILYRTHMHKAAKEQNKHFNNAQISKLLGDQWRALSDEEKAVWKHRQHVAKVEHKKIWPKYKYDPLQAWEKEQQELAWENDTEWRPADGMHQMPLPDTAANTSPVAANGYSTPSRVTSIGCATPTPTTTPVTFTRISALSMSTPTANSRSMHYANLPTPDSSFAEYVASKTTTTTPPKQLLTPQSNHKATQQATQNLIQQFNHQAEHLHEQVEFIDLTADSAAVDSINTTATPDVPNVESLFTPDAEAATPPPPVLPSFQGSGTSFDFDLVFGSNTNSNSNIQSFSGIQELPPSAGVMDNDASFLFNGSFDGDFDFDLDASDFSAPFANIPDSLLEPSTWTCDESLLLPASDPFLDLQLPKQD